MKNLLLFFTTLLFFSYQTTQAQDCTPGWCYNAPGMPEITIAADVNNNPQDSDCLRTEDNGGDTQNCHKVFFDASVMLADPCPPPIVYYTPWQGCGNGVGNIESSDADCNCISAAGGGVEVVVDVDPVTFIGEYVICTPSNRLNLADVQFCREFCFQAPDTDQIDENYECPRGLGGVPTDPPPIPAWAVVGSGPDDELDVEALFGAAGLIIYDFHCLNIEVEAVDVITDGDGCAGTPYLVEREWTVYTTDPRNPGAGRVTEFAFTQTYKWEDTTAPDFDQATLPADFSLECDEDVPVAETLTATDLCFGDSVVNFMEVSDLLGCNGTGTITRTWTAVDDCGNENEHIQVITIEDTTAPVAVPPGPETFECVDLVPPPGDLIATDNCQDDITVLGVDSDNGGAGCADEPLIITRTWTFTDECDNSETFTQTITVIDTTAPMIVDAAPDPITVSCAEELPPPPVLNFTDNCSADGTATFSEDPFTEDTCNGYTITRRWSAVDDCGNTAVELTQVITVEACPVDCLLAEPDINLTPQDTPVSGNVLSNDSDPNGDTFMVTGATGLDAGGNPISIPLGTATQVFDEDGNLAGEITINADGSYTFVPETGYTGEVPVMYEITDATGVVQETDLTISVIPTDPIADNDFPPVAQDDVATTESGVPVDGDLFGNDFEQEGETFTVTGATGLDMNGNPISIPLGTPTPIYDEDGNLAGTITVNSDGTFSFVPEDDFVATAPVDYEITDEDGLTDTATITLIVLDDVENNTFAEDDFNIGADGLPQTGNVLDNDFDPEGEAQEVTGGTTSDGTPIVPGVAVALPSGGTLTLNDDGTYTYLPAPGFVGTEVVTYTITDEAGNESVATLYLTTLPLTAILPIELLYFIAEQDFDDAILTWATSSEIDNSHFEVERSIDGINFEFVKRIESQSVNGFSDIELTYRFVDKDAASIGSQVFYKVKQVDFSGEFAFTPIRLVAFDESEVPFLLYPNPLQQGDVLQIVFDDIEDVRIFSSSGRLVGVVNENSKPNSTSFSTRDLASGVYIVIVNHKETKYFIVR